MPNKAKPQEQITQLAIDIPALQQYFHPEAPGRKPLKILVGNHVEKDWKLTKFDAAVQFVDKGDPKKTALLEVVTLQISGDAADAVLRYAIEGIEVKAKFSKSASGAWELTSHSLVER